MYKTLQKTVMVSSLLLGSIAVNSQNLLFEEHFDKAGGWSQKGYSEKTGCDTPFKITFTPSGPNIVETRTYANGLAVTYTIAGGAVADTCPAKGTGSTLSPGYVELNKLVGASLTFRIPANVTTIDLGISATGSTGRYVQVGKSVDGIVWDTVLTAKQTDQSNVATDANLTSVGKEYKNLPINANNPWIKVFGNREIIRVNDLWVNGISPSGLEGNSLFNNGAKVLVSDNNNISVTSPKSGLVQLLNVNGNIVAQSEIKNEVFFKNLQSGLYIVKLAVDNQVSVKKVMIQ